MWSSSGSSFVMSTNPSVSESPLHSIAQYIEDYMDLVENVPNDIARQISQLHENNHRYHQLLAQLESTLDLVCNKTTNELRKRNSVLKIQRSLIEIQEIADEKLLLIQSILDQLDGKARQLDFDYRSVTYNSTPNLTNNSRVQIQTSSSLATNNFLSNQRSEANSSTAIVSAVTSIAVADPVNESVAKEVVNGTTNGVSNDSCKESAAQSKRASARRNTGSRSTDNINENNAKRSVKRGVKTSHKEMKRSRNSLNNMNSNSNSSLLMGNSSPSIYEGTPIDPDEPTYCLCDQVSFGEMICCDNSDCKIEWFHFSCVSLTTKPKGKWFCPNCRGDRSNIQKK